MVDLTAASLEDVKQFFRTYYAPNNATLVIAGDFQRDSAVALGEPLLRRNPARARSPRAAVSADRRRCSATRSSCSRTR